VIDEVNLSISARGMKIKRIGRGLTGVKVRDNEKNDRENEKSGGRLVRAFPTDLVSVPFWERRAMISTISRKSEPTPNVSIFYTTRRHFWSDETRLEAGKPRIEVLRRFYLYWKVKGIVCFLLKLPGQAASCSKGPHRVAKLIPYVRG